jgi:hypothetical protein
MGQDCSVITDAAQATPDRLTAALLRSGTLRSGGVRQVEVLIGSEPAAWSRNARLRLGYHPGSQPGTVPALPGTLFLKMCQGSFGDSELRYYTHDYAGHAEAPLLRCHDACYQAEPRSYHLLLDDVTDSHQPCWDVAVTPGWLQALGDAAAALHAARWDAAALQAVGAGLPDAAAIERYVAHCRQGLAPLLASIDAEMRHRCEAPLHEVFDHLPRLMQQRCADPRGLCLVHGDLNPGNLLVSRTQPPPRGLRPLYLIDRQPFDWSLTVWLGVSDLAYLMCSHWPIEQRCRHQQALLQGYQRGLQQRGLQAPAWERLWSDYRLCALQAALVAVEWCVLEADVERMRWLWTEQLERALAVMEELDCRSLWRVA